MKVLSSDILKNSDKFVQVTIGLLLISSYLSDCQDHDGKIAYEISPAVIGYFETADLKFELIDMTCNKENFSLVQVDINGQLIDWMANNESTLWSENEFTLFNANFLQCGQYYAKCNFEEIQPHPIPVYFPVNPTIVDVKISDLSNASRVTGKMSIPMGLMYDVNAYLHEEQPTVLTFDLGLGSYEDNKETAIFTVTGHEIFSDDDADGHFVKDLTFEGYPPGQRRSVEFSLEKAATDAPNQCRANLNATVWMDSSKKASFSWAVLRMNFNYKPYNLSFEVSEEINEMAQHCILQCSLVSTCPSACAYTMKITDEIGRTIYSAKSYSGPVTMKLPFFNCEWLAAHREGQVICEAKNAAGSSSVTIPLRKVPGLDRYQPSYGGLTVVEGILIGVSILLAFSIGLNVYAIWRHNLFPSLMSSKSGGGSQQDDAGNKKVSPPSYRMQSVDSTSRMSELSSLPSPAPSSRTVVRRQITKQPSSSTTASSARMLPIPASPTTTTTMSDEDSTYIEPTAVAPKQTTPKGRSNASAAANKSQRQIQYEDEYSDATTLNSNLPAPVAEVKSNTNYRSVKQSQPATRPAYDPDDSLEPAYVDPTNKRFVQKANF